MQGLSGKALRLSEEPAGGELIPTFDPIRLLQVASWKVRRIPLVTRHPRK